MVQRIAGPRLVELGRWYGVVAVTGPRQSGKTTLARTTFRDRPYASLEDPDTRRFALADPRGFLLQFPDGAVLDEVQRAPELFSYLQGIVDDDGRCGRWVLTGSQQFGLVERITQSLAGRVGFLHLLPFSGQELWATSPPLTLEESLWRGFYPPVHDRNIPPHVWGADYLTTYVERDVRNVLDIVDLDAFHRFVLSCASRTGQLVNLTALGADCGITRNTAAAWLNVLEASYLVFRLQPWHRNFGKRLTKAPKLYFLDTGLAAWLAGVRDHAQLLHGAMRGPLFETWVVTEFLKNKRNQLGTEELYFWRDSAGAEIDLVVEKGDHVALIECKSGRTVASDWFGTLARVRTLTGASASAIVFGGEDGQARSDTPVFGWRDIASVFSAAKVA